VASHLAAFVPQATSTVSKPVALLFSDVIDSNGLAGFGNTYNQQAAHLVRISKAETTIPRRRIAKQHKTGGAGYREVPSQAGP
jgi:hypothetical protein